MRKRTGIELTCLVMLAASLTGVAARPAHADPTDYPIIGGDQATGRLLVFNPAASDWNDAASIEHTWQPTSLEGFDSEQANELKWISDFKLRKAGTRLVITGAQPTSDPGPRFNRAAIVDWGTGKKLWSTRVPAADNLHSAELLPNGNLVVTSTRDGTVANGTNGYVRVYASSQGPTTTDHADFVLNGSHAAVWDPVTERVWVIGKVGPGTDPSLPRVVTSLAVTGSPAHPHITQDPAGYSQLQLYNGDVGTHDLTPDPNDPSVLLLSAKDHTYEFDKSITNPLARFTPFPAGSGDNHTVKSISRQPSGQLVETIGGTYTYPDPDGCATVDDWCTDTAKFYGPNTTRAKNNAHFYRARVANPNYNAVGDTVHGPVSDRAWTAGIPWPEPSPVDTNPAVSVLAAAAVPDPTDPGEATLHFVGLVPSHGVWDSTRNADGTWNPAIQIDSNPGITAISAAALPNGTLHVQTVVPGAGVWDRTYANGSWAKSADPIDSNGAISAVSAAGLPNNTMHVQTLVPGAGVWDRTYANGSWADTADPIEDGCAGTGVNDPCITALSAAALPDGTVHLQTLTPTRGVSDLIRSAGGTWQTEPTVVDHNTTITRISSTALSDGTLHLQDVVPFHGLWNRSWNSSDGWAPSADHVDTNTAIFACYGAEMPDNTLHVGSAAYTS